MKLVRWMYNIIGTIRNILIKAVYQAHWNRDEHIHYFIGIEWIVVCECSFWSMYIGCDILWIFETIYEQDLKPLWVKNLIALMPQCLFVELISLLLLSPTSGSYNSVYYRQGGSGTKQSVFMANDDCQNNWSGGSKEYAYLAAADSIQQYNTINTETQVVSILFPSILTHLKNTEYKHNFK